MRRGAAVVLAGLMVLASCSRGGEPTVMGQRFNSYARPEPWAEDLFDEQAQVAAIKDAELNYIPTDYDATYTHVKDFERRSFDAGEGGPEVWFFGGSGMFGIGQRDEHTISSEIARLAAAEGTPVQVHSFGVPGYLSWQEAGLLGRVLARRAPPDLVVFYHGVNDLGAVCRQLALGVEPDGLGNPLLTPEPDDPKVSCQTDPEETGRLLAAVERRALASARQLVDPVPVLEFWQPYSATRVDTPSDGPLLKIIGVDAKGRPAMAVPYRATLRYLDPPAVDLTDALDDYDGPVYVDLIHTNERGAKLVAKAMWDRSLRTAVAQLG